MYIFGGYNALVGRHYNDIYEYDPQVNRWSLVVPIGEAPCTRRRQACVLVKDRLFLFGGTSPVCQNFHDDRSPDDKLIDHSDMYVLDLKPTLKTLCFIAIRRYKLTDSSLPQHVRVEYSNMFTSNKPALTRPSNSAG